MSREHLQFDPNSPENAKCGGVWVFSSLQRSLAHLQLSFHHPELVRVLELGQSLLDQGECFRKRIKGPLQLGRFHVHSEEQAMSHMGLKNEVRPASGGILPSLCQKPPSSLELIVLRLKFDGGQPDLFRIGICLRVDFGQTSTMLK